MSTDRKPFEALRDVARAERAAEADEELWLRRAGGELSAEEDRAASAASADARLAHMLELTAPTSAAQARDIEQTVLKALAPTRGVEPLARPRSLRPLVAGVLAMAAAALLIVVRVTEPADLVLPPYEASLQGVDVTARSVEDPAPLAPRRPISPGGHITLKAQPLQALPAKSELAARLFLVQGPHAESVDLAVELSPRGAVRVSAPYAALFGARTGDWDLVLFVGARGAVPKSAPEARTALSQRRSDLALMRFPLVLGR